MSTRRHHHKPAAPVFLVVALLLTAAVASLGGLSVARQVSTFQPLGFSAAAAGGGWSVGAVADAGTGLRTDDQILALQGQPVDTAAALAAGLRSRERSELLVLRDGELQTVTYQRPPIDVDVPYLVLALVGAAYLLIGFFTLTKDRSPPRGRAGASRLFFLWCLASAAFYLVTPGNHFDDLGRLLFFGDLAGRLALPPLTLHLFLVFPDRLPARGPRGGRWVPFLYLPAAFLLLVQLDLIVNGGGAFGVTDLGDAIALLDRAEILHLAVFTLAAVGLLAWRLLRRRTAGAASPEAPPTEDAWQADRQLRWIAVGMSGGYLPFLAFYGVPFLLGLEWPEPAVAASLVPLVLVPLTFAYAILRYKLWDIEVMVRETVSYTLTLLLGVIGFSLANLAISRGLPAETPLLRNVLVFLAGLTIAGVLVPARRGISGGLERIQYRDRFDKRRALLSFGRELLQERDLERLCGKLLAAVEEAVDLELTNLFLVRNGVLSAVRHEPDLPHWLPVDVLGGDFWDADVRRLAGTAFPGTTPLPAQHLFAAGYRYALPLAVHDNPVGMLVAGWKEDGERLSSDDVALLRQLLNQASLAIENAQLVDELRDRLDEVSRLQQYSEGIIESSPAGIAVLDRGGRIVTANQGFAELAGADRAALPGIRLQEVLAVGSLPEPGMGPVEVELEPNGDGEPRRLQVSTARFDRRGEGGCIVVVHDVTERAIMEAALKERDRLAALGVLAAGVAHEVNTPLTGISSYAQMLLHDTPPEDPRHDVLRKVERQTFRAARIVNSLLDFARNRAGEMGPVSLAGVVDDCLELLRERLTKRRIRVHWNATADAADGPEAPAELDAVVHGETGELQQVVTNLLLNAHDAMEEGGDLRLELERDDAAGVARLTVADSGSGIPPENLERIFEPFVTTKLGRGGTGLGLAISADIVRHHGGRLSVDSRPGEGAAFTLELPLESARGSDRGDDGAGAPPPDGSGGPPSAG